MDIKKTIFFSLGVWLFLTILFYILNLIPVLEKNIYFFTVVWIFIIIKLFFLSKWYFRKTTINIKNGFILGLISSLVSAILIYFVSFNLLDLKIENESLYLSVTFLEILLFCTYAGFEFDKTFTESK